MIDYPDFIAPVSGLSSKIGLDAANKRSDETARERGRPITMSEEIINKIDAIWDES